MKKNRLIGTVKSGNTGEQPIKRVFHFNFKEEKIYGNIERKLLQSNTNQPVFDERIKSNF